MGIESLKPGSWLKLGDAAHALGVSEITLRRKVKCGKIPHDFRNGKYFVYLYKDEKTGVYFDPSGASDTSGHLAPYENIPRNSQLPSIHVHSGVPLGQVRHDENVADLESRLEEAEEELHTLRNGMKLKDANLQNLRRTLEDQQTLIVFLEDTINRLGQNTGDASVAASPVTHTTKPLFQRASIRPAK